MIAHKVIQCPSGTCVCDTLPLQLYIYLIVYLIYWLFLYLFLFLLRLPRLFRSSRTLWMGRVWKGGHRCSTPQTWPACFVALVLPFVQVPGLLSLCSHHKSGSSYWWNLMLAVKLSQLSQVCPRRIILSYLLVSYRGCYWQFIIGIALIGIVLLPLSIVTQQVCN